jgi:hypothetical protein
MVAEVGYNGVIGARLQSQLLQYDQRPSKYLAAFGSIDQSTAVLNSRLGSTLANAAGITEPYPGFSAFWATHGARRSDRRYGPTRSTTESIHIGEVAITAGIRLTTPPSSVSKRDTRPV